LLLFIISIWWYCYSRRIISCNCLIKKKKKKKIFDFYRKKVYVLMKFDAFFDQNFFDAGLSYVDGSCRSWDLKDEKNHFRWLFKGKKKKMGLRERMIRQGHLYICIYNIIFMFNDINQLIQKLTFSFINLRNKKESIVKITIIYNHILVVFFFGRRRRRRKRILSNVDQ
jgi:hypothetical protein